MKSLLKRVALLLALALLLLPSVAMAQGFVFATVSRAGGTSVLYGPGNGYRSLDRLADNSRVIVIGKNVDTTWLQVRISGNRVGWVPAAYLLPDESLSTVPVTSYTGINNAFVATSALNLRAGPSAKFEILNTFPAPTSVNLVARNADASWVLVDLPGAAGWMSTRYIVASNPISQLPSIDTSGLVPGYTLSPTQGMVIADPRMNLRYGPGINYPIIDKLRTGVVLELLGRNVNGDWYKVIEPHGGATGWVSALYILTEFPVSEMPIITTLD